MSFAVTKVCVYALVPERGVTWRVSGADKLPRDQMINRLLQAISLAYGHCMATFTRYSTNYSLPEVINLPNPTFCDMNPLRHILQAI